MTTELFSGTPEDLKTYLDALIVAESPTTLQVIPTAEKTTYLIIYS